VPIAPGGWGRDQCAAIATTGMCATIAPHIAECAALVAGRATHIAASGHGRDPFHPRAQVDL
jgi:hypothetical protein